MSGWGLKMAFGAGSLHQAAYMALRDAGIDDAYSCVEMADQARSALKECGLIHHSEAIEPIDLRSMLFSREDHEVKAIIQKWLRGLSHVTALETLHHRPLLIQAANFIRGDLVQEFIPASD